MAQPAPNCKGTTFEIKKAGNGGKAIAKGSNATPFSYQAGVGGVIKGWDQGCLGMTVGEVRELVIPADEGYGANGFPAWGIPPGGTLNFTLECLEVQ
ncbi:peptidyl-prolyl cis-trans isomerase [Aureococcus anophagefferens]|nr:peptidyl-prolyl cis-trans isomerase [Aureococcus anophagefferens]